MDAPADRVTLVRLESERLRHYLQSLPPEAWRQPSACPLWRVDDVVTHLAGGGLSCAASIARGLQGDAAPPMGPLAAEATTDVLRFAASLARELQRDRASAAGRTAAHRAQIVIAARQRLGDQVLATFQATRDYLQQVIERCGPADLQTPCYHRLGVMPVQTLLDLRLTELAIHSWDIRSRLESDAPLSPESVPVLIEPDSDPIEHLWFRGFQSAFRSIRTGVLSL